MLHQIPLLLMLALTFEGDTARVMDGHFEDWTCDPVSQGPQTGSIRAIRVADDPHFVYLQIDLDKPSTLQGLERELRFEFDLDGRDKTGAQGSAGLPGVDAVTLFSPIDEQTGKTRPGSALFSTAPGRQEHQTTDALGVVAMPTHGSSRFEIRFNRLPAFRGKRFSGHVLLASRDGIVEETVPFTHTFSTSTARKAPTVLHDPAEPAERGAIRTASWNGEQGALFKNPAPFVRSIEALDPDLLLLQELPSDAGSTDLAQWLDRLDGDNTWTVAISGGSLRVAVATRHKLEPVAELARIEAPDPRGTKRAVRAIGALATINGSRVLAVSIHLKCCGRLGSTEDEKRRSQVEGIREAVRLAIDRLKPDAVVIGGDFNLVGSPAILQRLREGLAPDGTDLLVTEPIRPTGDSTTTWENPGQAFVPGRLDFILVGGAFEVERELVVDPAQMSERWRRKHGIPAEAPSDHLLLSIDLAPDPDS